MAVAPHHVRPAVVAEVDRWLCLARFLRRLTVDKVDRLGKGILDEIARIVERLRERRIAEHHRLRGIADRARRHAILHTALCVAVPIDLRANTAIVVAIAATRCFESILCRIGVKPCKRWAAADAIGFGKILIEWTSRTVKGLSHRRPYSMPARQIRAIENVRRGRNIIPVLRRVERVGHEELPDIARAFCRPRLFRAATERRHEQRRKDADHGDHRQQLDQREAGAFFPRVGKFLCRFSKGWKIPRFASLHGPISLITR